MTGTSPAVDLEHLLAEEGFVRSLARSLLFDEHQVDDVVQQTWLQALRRPPATAASLRGWLAQVVRSQASNLRRGEQRRRDREQAVVEGLPSNEEILGRETERRAVVEAAVALPEPYRSAILLRYFEQLPPRVIAARLGVPRGTVATRLKRALQMLRKTLDERHGGDRRSWCLSLIPLAAPPRAAAGMLLTKATSVLGALWAMKQVALLLVAIAAMLVLGTQLLWGGEAAGTAEAARVPAVVTSTPARAVAEEEAMAAEAPAATAPPRRAHEDEAVAPSVLRALAGFRGRLLLPDGSPAAGQLVRVIGVDPLMAFGGDADPFEGVRYEGPVSRSARTDESGNFLVEGVWPGALCALHAGVDGPHPRLSLLSRTPGPAEVVDLGDVQLAAKGAVRGKVVDPDGEPVADAEVWAVDLPGALLDLAPIDRFGPGSALFVALPRVAPGRSPDRDPDGYGEILRRHISMELFQQVPTDGWVVMELPAWGNRFVAEWPIPRTRTAADGSFHLVGVDPGANVLVARRPGLATGGSKRVLIKAGQTRDVGTLDLARGEQVSGVVVDGDGQPVAGAQVRIAPRPALGLTGLLFAEREHRADAAGRFRVNGLPRGAFVVAARRAPGAAWAFAEDVEAGDDDVEVALPAGELGLEVHTEQGAELDGVELVIRQGPPLGELTTAGLTPALDPEQCLAKLGGGRYRLHDLAAGLYTVHVRAAGYAPETRVVRVGETTAEDTARFVLQPEVSCVVEVVDRRGRPVHGASVYAQPAAQPVWAHSVVMGESGEGLAPWSRLPRLAGHTDATGHLEVTGLPAGDALFSVRHPAFGAASAKARVPQPQRFVLEETGSIRGRLFDQGEPAQPDAWRLLAVSAEDDDPTGMPPPLGQATPGADGSYVFAGLPPGRYSVRVEASLAGVTSFGALFEKLKGTYTGSFFRKIRQEPVVVRPGQESLLDLDVDETRGVPGTTMVRLTGRVTIDGAPAQGLELFSGDAMFETLLTRTLPDGSFTLERLKPQNLWLRLADPRSSTNTLWLACVTVGDRDLQLDIALGTGTLRGRVLAKTGEPAAGHEVSISGWVDGAAADLSPRSAQTVVTDADGRFEVRVPAGRHACRCTGTMGHGASAEQAVEAGATVECEITLRPDGMLAGRVADLAAGDCEWLWVRMEPVEEDHGGWSMARVGDDGSYHFTGVPPGRYRVFLIGRQRTPSEAEPEAVPTGSRERKAVPHVVEIPEGGRLDQDLRAGEPVQSGF